MEGYEFVVELPLSGGELMNVVEALPILPCVADCTIRSLNDARIERYT